MMDLQRYLCLDPRCVNMLSPVAREAWWLLINSEWIIQATHVSLLGVQRTLGGRETEKSDLGSNGQTPGDGELLSNWL